MARWVPAGRVIDEPDGQRHDEPAASGLGVLAAALAPTKSARDRQGDTPPQELPEKPVSGDGDVEPFRGREPI